jgi:TolB-like protein
MLHLFDEFELDTWKVELRQGGNVVPLEPQVFALLLLLVENSERMVSKDEIVEKIWDGRIVSDSAVTSRIKFVRRALGDDGKAQRFIRTVHGQGFRFVAKIRTLTIQFAAASDHDHLTDQLEKPSPNTRPSIVVLPFKLLGAPGSHLAIADALPHDLIVALSRLRWIFVIARGTSFRFRSADHDIKQIGKAVNARYCLSGAVEIFGSSINISVELGDTSTGGVVWADRRTAKVDDIHEVRAQIVANIISALEIQIPMNEAHSARLTAPENLDAWSAYHLGLLHMYRFNQRDNAVANTMFARAVAQEPGLARAHAGLSFTHFQNAFLGYPGDRKSEINSARKCAERSVELDPVDPFANLVMGRTFWLDGDLDGSLPWLDRSTSLSPNYAHGFYARAWVDTISERGVDGRENVQTAMALSPLDPFLYAMKSACGLSYLAESDHTNAAFWADKAARTPGAHVLIALIAAVSHFLNGDGEKAAVWVADVRRRRPEITADHFFRAFPYCDGQLRQRISKALTQQGF